MPISSGHETLSPFTPEEMQIIDKNERKEGYHLEEILKEGKLE